MIAVDRPLRLSEAAPPAKWRFTIQTLVALARAHDLELRVFGSFAWATITGLDYISDDSDLDLLLPLTAATLDMLPCLSTIEDTAPGRLDGEVVAPNGDAVHWRELASGATELLVKRADGVVLLPRHMFCGG